MRQDTKNKLVRFSLIGFSITLWLFIIIFNSVWYTTPTPKEVGFEFMLTFYFPLSLSVISMLVQAFFKSFTKKDAINQIEKQYRNGLISTAHYQKSLNEIEMFELEKLKLKAKIEVEKEKIKQEVYKSVEKTKKEFLSEKN